jgi:serine/threonine protein phosphatase PrpC
VKRLLGYFRKYTGKFSQFRKIESNQQNLLKAGIDPIYPKQLVYGCSQSVGKQRDHNEDFLFAFGTSIGGENKSSAFGFFVVADGMGGHQFGEVASFTAVRSVTDFIINKYHSFFTRDLDSIKESPLDIMQAAIQEAQRAVIKAAPGSGTTLTAALVINNQVIIGHVGDSRAYEIHGSGKLELITRDHSLVKKLEELGQITTDEALTHPQRNVLLQAIGHGEFIEGDVFSITFPQPGYIMLCSDGLWGVVPGDLISKIIIDSTNPQSACLEMVSAANNEGGPDNISVILILLRG